MKGRKVLLFEQWWKSHETPEEINKRKDTPEAEHNTKHARKVSLTLGLGWPVLKSVLN